MYLNLFSLYRDLTCIYFCSNATQIRICEITDDRLFLTVNLKTGLSAIFYRKCHPNYISALEPKVANVFNRTKAVLVKRCASGPTYTEFLQILNSRSQMVDTRRSSVHGYNVTLHFPELDFKHMTVACFIEGFKYFSLR
jgi:hypothetical protein